MDKRKGIHESGNFKQSSETFVWFIKTTPLCFPTRRMCYNESNSHGLLHIIHNAKSNNRLAFEFCGRHSAMFQNSMGLSPLIFGYILNDFERANKQRDWIMENNGWFSHIIHMISISICLLQNCKFEWSRSDWVTYALIHGWYVSYDCITTESSTHWEYVKC